MKQKRVITKTRSTAFSEVYGECEGRRVKWTYSVNMWLFVDTGDYVFGEYEYK